MAHRRSGTDRTSSAEPGDPAARRAPHTFLAIAAIAAALVAPIVVFVRAFDGVVHPLGPDVFGYIWQTRIVGMLPLASVGTRPGFPVFASVLCGLHVTTAATAPLVLGPVTAAVFAGAIAATVALAFRLPAWGLAPIAFTVAVWGGATHMATGYLANELSLAAIAAAVFLLGVPAADPSARVFIGSLAAAFAAVVASGLAHPGLLPFYVGVAAAWLVLSLPARRADGPSVRIWIGGPGGFLVLLIAAAVIVAIVVFGVMGQRLSDVTNLTEGVADFGDRLRETVGIVGLWVSALSVLAVIGIVAAWRMRGERSRGVIRLGIAWAAVAAAGAVLTLARASFPGHRALLMMVPLPAAAGLGIVGAAWAVLGAGRGGGRIATAGRIVAAIAVVGMACLLVTLPGSTRLAALARLPVRGDPARLVASYVATVRPDVPVLVLSSPTTERIAPFTWRGRQNQVRAYVPSVKIVDTFVVVGVPLGRGGVARPRAGGGAATEAIEESWRQAGSAPTDGAVVVAPKAFTAHRVWERLAADPSRLVTSDLAVIRGPTTAPAVAVAPAQISGATADRDAIASLLALLVLGGGFALAAVWKRSGTVAHALALAPALGAVTITLVGVGLALIGADPAGGWALAACVLIAAAGYWQARRAWSARSPSAVSSAP